VTISDATGNVWTNRNQRMLVPRGPTDLLFSGTLAPSEIAWKLRVELSQATGFRPSELWSVRGVPIPKRDELLDPAAAPRRQGTELRLSLAGAGDPPRMRRSWRQPFPTISVTVSPSAPGLDLTLLRATDDQERPLYVFGGHPASMGGGEYHFDLDRLPPGAKTMNLLFAIVLFTTAYMTGGPSDTPSSNDKVYVGQLMPKFPAEAAGLQLGDIILKVNDTDIQTPEQLRDVITAAGGKPVTLLIVRHNQQQTIQLTPRYNQQEDRYMIGVTPGITLSPQQHPLRESLQMGLDYTWRIIKTTGMRIINMNPAQGFAAQGAGAAVILTSSHFGYPLSSTHVITGGVMGAGAAKRVSAVRWGVAGNIATAWVLTLPAAGLLGAGAYGLQALLGAGLVGPLITCALGLAVVARTFSRHGRTATAASAAG